MTRWTTKDLPDLSGRTVVITGAGRGLGLITARELARAGARVVLGVRDTGKARRAVAGLPGAFDVRPLDVADLASVRAFADSWSGDLDILINNAGVMDIPGRADRRRARSADHHQLHRSFPADRPAARPHHRPGRARHQPAAPAGQDRPGRPRLAHAHVPRDERLPGVEAGRRPVLPGAAAPADRRGSPVRSVLASPGIARTALAAHSRSNVVNRFKFLTNDPEQGRCRCSTPPPRTCPATPTSGPDGPGGLRGYPAIRRQGKAGLDEEMAARLWDTTAGLVGMVERPEFGCPQPG